MEIRKIFLGSVIQLKGQLHVHTSFSDGTLTPQEVADTYESLGFDFITYTDHDHLLKPSYKKVIKGVCTNLIVFIGVELTLHTRWGYIHVNQIQGDNEMLHIFNHPADYGLSMKQFRECLEDIGGRHRIDAVEVSHQGFYTPQYDCEMIPYPKVATDDSHTRLGCGRAWIEIECERNKDAILRQIKKNDFKNWFAKGHKQNIVKT